jgi:hypothetical protein
MPISSSVEHIHTHSSHVRDGATEYEARIYGGARGDGTWAGWIEFHPVKGEAPVLRTEQETSQPNRVCVEYWASGLEPIYLEGALERAKAERAA